MNKIYFKILGTFFATVLLFSCKYADNKVFTEKDVALEWARMTIHITQITPGNTPTNASRALGYIGLTMYESIVFGFPEYNSMKGQLNELKALPKADHTEKNNWIISLNAGQAQILRNIYNQTSDANKFKIDSLEKLIFRQVSERNSDKNILNKSAEFGRSVADSIFSWSKTDGGHKAYLKNFDKTLTWPQKLGGWKPPLYAQSFSHFPLHPHWGENRTFLKINSDIADPKFIAFNTDSKSDYYKQYLEVYNKRKNLSQAEKEAAVWWGDDPDETPTPPGHSYYLAVLALEKTDASLIKCAETFAKVGMGVADAFRDCWKWKYKFFSERPNTFITEHIDNQWESFWPDPPFPAFPSGHAIQAATTATILTELFGDKFETIDDTHKGRKRDEIRNVDFKTRTFHSFWEIANETANSRFYGGIHTKQDNEAGLIKGKEIGGNINNLIWKKKRIQ
jgi:PAP2 superfamily/Vanadium chloroperoxidase N-terminal domain